MSKSHKEFRLEARVPPIPGELQWCVMQGDIVVAIIDPRMAMDHGQAPKIGGKIAAFLNSLAA